MNLQIRHPKARSLARRLANLRDVSMTQAVVEALEADLARRERADDIVESIGKFQERLRRMSRPGGRMMTKEEIDEMWGHPPDEIG